MKDPAAVALGKRGAAKRTAEQQAAITATLTTWRKTSTHEERRAIAKRAARTRRLSPAWVTMSSSPAESAAAPVFSPPETLAPLQVAAAAIIADADNMSTQELLDQAEALFAGFRAK